MPSDALRMEGRFGPHHHYFGLTNVWTRNIPNPRLQEYSELRLNSYRTLVACPPESMVSNVTRHSFYAPWYETPGRSQLSREITYDNEALLS